MHLTSGPTRKSTVALDARMAFHSGIGRYIRGLTRALLDADSPPELSLLGVPTGGDPDWLAGRAVTNIAYSAGIYTPREQILGSWVCRRLESRVSVFHFPHYNVPLRLPRASVVTIHDLTHLQFPEYFSPLQVAFARRVLKRAVTRARSIITVSEATRRTLDRFFPGTAGKATVIHHGVDEPFRRLPPERLEDLRRRHGKSRFLLYAGNAKPHKNLPRILEAFEQIREGSDPPQLVLALTADAEPPPVPEGVRILRGLSDTQLAEWYNLSEALLLPSLNEGFGLTALEAMACGTPVIGSTTEALQEVVGDAGLLVDPEDVGAIASAMRLLLVDDVARAGLAARACARARRFTWERAAEQTLEVYSRSGR
jgi:glycosyltransferase involved in cell wall biosynthesis